MLNKDKQLNAKQFVLSLFFIGSFISPIFGRFFRSSLDFKYFYALVGKRDGKLSHSSFDSGNSYSFLSSEILV